jgi:RNA polymerase sigma factor (sigma-70 family)
MNTERIYREYNTYLLAWAGKYGIFDKQVAQTLVHDAFISFIRYYDIDKGGEKTFITEIMINKCKRYHLFEKYPKTKIKLYDIDKIYTNFEFDIGNVGEVIDMTEEDFEDKDKKLILIFTYIENKFKIRDVNIFMRYYKDQMSYQEIADFYSIDLQTIKNVLRIGKEKIKRYFDRQ